ncbi:hypothetical protein DERF_013163 [Dermatophagoides farinae]|uniref:Cyclase n=2 Tax=Dermatophagoides farinae TaxID=6954 RepID=A0A922KVZ0_DERFA|nr:hypothetical protein HUG17_6197 [Dermatophagoides farinae]KAH9497159.1 hypothetical protein DERF_013163 [Dermatophagoides farinae]
MTLLSLIGIYLLLVLKPLFFVQISAHRMTIDLSYKMDAKIMKWITARPYELRILSRDKKIGNQTIRIQSDETFMSTHTGTHLDAPIHFGGQDKWSVADIPLKNLINRPLAVIDVVDKASHQLDYLATVRDLEEWEKINGKILIDSVIIIRTGWSQRWPNKLEYFGTETNDPKQAHFPGLHPKAAKWLVEQRQIVGIGIDGPSIDCGQCNGKGSHIILNSNNIYILENIEKSIFTLKSTGATITILPLKLADASGCPVRPIAEYNDNHDES